MGNHHEGHAFVRSFVGLGLFGIRAVHAVGVTRMTPRLIARRCSTWPATDP
jgi:hypothetical protein